MCFKCGTGTMMFLYCNVLLYVICHSQAARQTASGLDQTKQTHLQQGRRRMWSFSVTVSTFVVFKYNIKIWLWLLYLNIYSSRIANVLVATGIVKLEHNCKCRTVLFFFFFACLRLWLDCILLLKSGHVL